MTTFDEQAVEFSQRPVSLVDIDIPFCPLVYGKGICAPDSRELFAIEGTAGWTPAADDTLLDDDTFALNGVRSLRIDKTGTTVTFVAPYRQDLEGTGDLTGRTMRIAFNVKASLLAVIAAPGLFVRLGDGFSDYKDWYISAGSVKAGLNLLEFEFDSPDATVGTPGSEPVHLQFGAFTALASSTFTDGLSVDDFILLSDNPQAFPCYNTRATCRDAAHFFTQKSTKKFRFSVETGPIVTGAPGPPIIQAIKSRGITLIPTKIDRERGYGRRDLIQVKLTDFIDDDALQDPYLSSRARKPDSYFFRKFIARNPYLKGTILTLREGLGIDNPDTGRVRVNLSEFKTRQYTIERMNGPDKRGVITFVAKDILKELDNQQIPSPSDAKTLDGTTIDPTQDEVTLEEGSVEALMTQFSEAGFTLSNGMFYVRIDDEIMFVTEDPTGGNILKVERGRLGSEADEHGEASKVQLVQSWIDQRVDDIWYDIQIQSNIDTSLIDLAGAQTETDLFLTEFVLTAHISEPTKSSDLMKALNLQCGTNTWWDTESQVTRLKPIRPRVPGEPLVRTLTDESDMVGDSVDIQRQEKSRITNAFVYFEVINWAGSFSEPGNYRKAILFIDADAESEDQYNDQKSRTFFSYFFPSTFRAIATSTAARYVANFRDPKKAIKLRLTTKDGAFVKPGDLVNLETFGLVDFDGRVRTTPAFVIAKKRLDALGIQWEFELEDDEFAGQKFAFWAPETAPDLGAAGPDDLEYAYWSGEDCLLPDGTDPYLWV